MKECWEALPTETVKKSFRACGISVHTDGTEDGEIHCLKEGGVAADARKTIERDTAALVTATDSLEESDPFADVEEDEEELENELVLEDCMLIHYTVLSTILQM